MAIRNTPPRVEGKADVVQVAFEKDLPQRTLNALFRVLDYDTPLTDEDTAAALAVLAGAFREANCDVALFDCYFLDLDGNRRVVGQSADGNPTTIVCDALPPVGAVLQWQGQSIYIASHKA